MALVTETEPIRRHIVKFYDDDADLIGSVSSYLAERYHPDEVAVVIASPDHVRALEAVVTEPRIMIDAAETLATIIVDGVPDRDAFETAVGSVFRRIAEGGGRARAYGEMVGLLYAAGDIVAAIKLEGLWNTLLDGVELPLFCAYPGSGIDPNADEVGEVCALHTEVHGAGLVDVWRDFNDASTTPRAARHFVSATLSNWNLAHLLDEAAVVVTELTTNSVMHAGTALRVTVTLAPGAVRIEVFDRSPVLPEMRPATVERGRGLMLVDRLSSDWGAERAEGGKLVWAELHDAEALA
jgi:anti-sigma regulatory factor (Ser/Thr protein kinase)